MARTRARAVRAGGAGAGAGAGAAAAGAGAAGAGPAGAGAAGAGPAGAGPVAASAGAAERLRPASAAEAAALLRDAGPVRIRGGGTKPAWGRPVAAARELSTERMAALVAHHAGDLTAVVQAGLPLADAQAAFAAAGQMLALDPPDGGATIGGTVATGDSGPLRHRYGAPRDLVLGVQVALPDGTVARAGSQVIKNVAGYDLAKLMSGACGTLGVICELTVRLHPRPAAGWCTAIGRGDDPHALARAAAALCHLPLEADAIDLRWEGAAAAGSARAFAAGSAGAAAAGSARAAAGGGEPPGAVLARFSGPAAGEHAEAAVAVLREHGLACATAADDEPLWAAQRDGQRGPVVLRVSGTQRRLGAIVAAARDHGARLVARAAYGLAWMTLPGDPPPAPATGPAATSAPAPDSTAAPAAAESPGRAAGAASSAALAAQVRELRERLAPSACVLLSGPPALRAAVDPWGPVAPGRLELMRRVKERFDPDGRCNPGLFVGGI